MKTIASILLALAPSMAWAQPVEKQDSRVKLVEVDRLVLRNGNHVDGRIVGTNDDEVIMEIKGALLGVRKEHIIRSERVLLRVRLEEPKPEKPVKPVKEPPAVTPSKEPTQPGPSTALSLKDFPQVDPAIVRRIEELFVKMRQGTDTDRLVAAEEMSKTGADGQICLVASLLTEEDLAPWVLTAIGRIGPSKGLPFLIKMLPQLRDQTKSLIFGMLGQVKYKEGIDAIAPYLDHKEPAVRAAAIEALASLDSTAHFSKILDCLGTEDENLALRVMVAVETLARLPSFKEEACAQIVKVLDQSDNARARGQAAVVAGHLQIPEAKTKLLELLHNDSAPVRAQAVMALAELKDKDIISALGDQLVLERDQWTKVQIIQALQKTKSPEAIPLLIKQLRDGNEQIRSRAATALTTITGQQFGEDAEKWEAWSGVPR